MAERSQQGYGIILEFYWRSERWNEGVQKCRELIDELAVNHHDDSPALQSASDEVLYALNAVHNFLLFMSDHPYDSDGDTHEWLSRSVLKHSDYGVDSLFSVTDRFGFHEHKGKKDSYLPERLKLEMHRIPDNG